MILASGNAIKQVYLGAKGAWVYYQRSTKIPNDFMSLICKESFALDRVLWGHNEDKGGESRHGEVGRSQGRSGIRRNHPSKVKGEEQHEKI